MYKIATSIGIYAISSSLANWMNYFLLFLHLVMIIDIQTLDLATALSIATSNFLTEASCYILLHPSFCSNIPKYQLTENRNSYQMRNLRHYGYVVQATTNFFTQHTVLALCKTSNGWPKCQNRSIPCKGRHSPPFLLPFFEKEVREVDRLISCMVSTGFDV